MVWHPNKYANLLAEKMEEFGATAWLINTGWVGGGYGVGERIKLRYTRAIIDAIHSGELSKAATTTDPIFGFKIPTLCSGVPTELLVPKNAWTSAPQYDAQAAHLAQLFNTNFEKFKEGCSNAIAQAGPKA